MRPRWSLAIVARWLNRESSDPLEIGFEDITLEEGSHR